MERLYIPNWFSVEVKTGVRAVGMTMVDCVYRQHEYIHVNSNCVCVMCVCVCACTACVCVCACLCVCTHALVNLVVCTAYLLNT